VFLNFSECSHPLQQIDGAPRITPLIIVPGNHFHEVAIHDESGERIENARGRIADHIRIFMNFFAVSAYPVVVKSNCGSKAALSIFSPNRIYP
jgi:hypothetical protein